MPICKYVGDYKENEKSYLRCKNGKLCGENENLSSARQHCSGDEECVGFYNECSQGKKFLCCTANDMQISTCRDKYYSKGSTVLAWSH